PPLLGLDLAVARGRARVQVVEQLRRCQGHGVDRTLERFLIRARGCVEAADLPHVLERCPADLLIGGGRLEVVEGSNVSTHGVERSRSLRDRINPWIQVEPRWGGDTASTECSGAAG